MSDHMHGLRSVTNANFTADPGSASIWVSTNTDGNTYTCSLATFVGSSSPSIWIRKLSPTAGSLDVLSGGITLINFGASPGAAKFYWTGSTWKLLSYWGATAAPTVNA